MRPLYCEEKGTRNGQVLVSPLSRTQELLVAEEIPIAHLMSRENFNCYEGGSVSFFNVVTQL